MEKLVILGTGNANATKCYNTCLALQNEQGYFLADAGGGNGILVQLEKAGIPLGEIHEKLGTYRLLKKQPSVTEIRRCLALLKRYQLIEPLDILEEMDGQSRLVIYPTVNVVLMGDDVRALIETYTEGDEEDDESEV